MSLPAVHQAATPNALAWPFSQRALMALWNTLYQPPVGYHADAARDAVWNRGAYLAGALGHCGECHTPRNFLGGAKQGRFLAGGKLPEGGTATNLTPTRLKKWGDKDLAEFLVTGMTADGDVVAESIVRAVSMARSTSSALTSLSLIATMPVELKLLM